MPWSADGRYRIVPEFGGPDDPFFGLPLWLRVDCCGHVLWAYNRDHLNLIEAYVSARLRKRGMPPHGMSMVEQLPAWMKDAKHRDDILSGIRKLRDMVV